MVIMITYKKNRILDSTMTRFKVFYEGDLHTKIINESNQAELLTDAPLDHGGKGEYFSPTDLVAISLGSCIATVMGLFAKKKKLDLSGLSLKVEKEMSITPPRRISHIKIELFMSKTFSTEINQALETVAHNCPVHQSLHPSIHVDIIFHWP